MIKIEMKPTQYEVEVPGYGKFKISPLGAGAEAEIRMRFRELDDLMQESNKFKYIADKENAGEEVDKESEEYKAAIESLKKCAAGVDRLRDTIIEKLRCVIKGDNVDKLFDELSYEQILELQKRATKRED